MTFSYCRRLPFAADTHRTAGVACSEAPRHLGAKLRRFAIHYLFFTLKNIIAIFFVFSPPPKPPPMNRCRTYRLMNPLTGIWPAYGDVLGYRYASPAGDAGCNNQHLGANHVSATTPPRCDGSTTILHSSFLILNWSHIFSAKERDLETGLSYFGSRYYSSDLSIWLSVDPMSDKYPSLSPYVYCADNPVKLVDPNGEEWYVNQNGNIVEGTNKEKQTLYAVKGKKNEFGDRLIYRRGDHTIMKT